MITQIFELIDEADYRYFHDPYPCSLPGKVAKVGVSKPFLLLYLFAHFSLLE